MHSQQNSANELDQKEIDSLTEGLEGVLDKVSSLRSIDLKNTEPASIYKPIKKGRIMSELYKKDLSELSQIIKKKRPPLEITEAFLDRIEKKMKA